MKTLKTVALHILCWVLVLGYFYGGSLIEGTTLRASAFTISMNFIQIMEFYICYLWVYPRFLKKGKTPFLIGGSS
ncbi:hypothetical protein G7074_16950 [Pedobacter sp. HDW13]|uniref:hypothetical protein n=1 Tax=Pedobacter sp. HDW13 TaxID=2714940 RepID=UPI00140C029E|nr:hypothetical protein [Pedobacter sp. HDW13]QIL40801.1 hypothetical protein G7074_16950 [Pedobacter sp. HDW13]